VDPPRSTPASFTLSPGNGLIALTCRVPRIDLTGKPIAITGASSGIGAATALACAAAGMPVALGARREDKLRLVVERITKLGGRAIAVPMDVCVPTDNQRLIDECVRAFGSIYSVYANAGYGEEAAIADMSDHAVRAMFETNFFGTLATIRAALPAIERNPLPSHDQAGPSPVRGHVLICSSCLGKMWVPYYSVYSASKAAQNHIGRAMNIELRPKGIRVSTIHPIGTKTEFFEVVEHRAGGKPVRSLKTPDSMMEPAELVARRTVDCLRSPRPEVWTSFRGACLRWGMGLANVMPGASDFVLRRLAERSGP
jgi:short-subunit dehydrogenase